MSVYIDNVANDCFRTALINYLVASEDLGAARCVDKNYVAPLVKSDGKTYVLQGGYLVGKLTEGAYNGVLYLSSHVNFDNELELMSSQSLGQQIMRDKILCTEMISAVHRDCDLVELINAESPLLTCVHLDNPQRRHWVVYQTPNSIINGTEFRKPYKNIIAAVKVTRK